MHYFPAHIQVLYMEGGKGASPSQDLRKLIASVAVVGKLKQGTRRQFKKLEGISIAIRIEEKYFFSCSKLINSTQLTNNLTYATSVKCLSQSLMLIASVFKSISCILSSRRIFVAISHKLIKIFNYYLKSQTYVIYKSYQGTWYRIVRAVSP